MKITVKLKGHKATYDNVHQIRQEIDKTNEMIYIDDFDGHTKACFTSKEVASIEAKPE